MASILHEVATIIALYCKAIFATKVCALFPDWALAGLYILCQTHERHKKKLSLKQSEIVLFIYCSEEEFEWCETENTGIFAGPDFVGVFFARIDPIYTTECRMISFWDGKENWEKYPEEDHIVYSFNIPIYKIFDLLTNAFSAICSIIFVMHVCKLL